MVDGGGHWLVRMELRPAGWSVCLPLLKVTQGAETKRLGILEGKFVDSLHFVKIDTTVRTGSDNCDVKNKAGPSHNL